MWLQKGRRSSQLNTFFFFAPVGKPLWFVSLNPLFKEDKLGGNCSKVFLETSFLKKKKGSGGLAFKEAD